MALFTDIPADSLEGGSDLLGPLAGKVLLVVNVASECGLTPQYDGLQRLHEELAAHGFSVVGFPCNQFGHQEPGSADDIRRFCTSSYGVTFPLGAKLEVNGEHRAPVYDWLTDPAHGFPGDIAWNFEKFLIGRDGRIRGRYPPDTRPEDPVLLQDIAEALEESLPGD
ncbi:MAG: glutathione peroxidase [Gammaproteobacteria bacterium SG8_31]|jgi:glutathione peroxidase|nr:MAG: glutathione peroxidase [Gammaproteobacteria bacterium SG8_31]